MANIQITQLPVAIALTGTEQMELVQAGDSVRGTVQQVVDFVNDHTGTVTSVDVASDAGANGFTFSGGPITAAGTITFTISDQLAARTSLGIGTLPSGDIVGTTDVQTLSNKSLVDASTYVIDNVDATKRVKFEVSGVATATTRTWTFPNVDDTFVGIAAAQTLTNKTITRPTITLQDTTTTFQDNADNTKQVVFELSGIATATTRTWTFPNTNDTFVGVTSSQTLTNKTLTSPTINTPTLTVNDNAFTIQDEGDTTKKVVFQLSGLTTATTRTWSYPDASDTFVGLAATQTLTNKTITRPTITLQDTTTTFQDNADNTKQVVFELSGISAATTRTWTFPNATDTFVGVTGTQTMTNKSLQDSTTFFVDDVDATKRVQFQISGITTATTRTWSYPDVSDTFVGLAATQTLTSKTLTSPTVNGATISGTFTSTATITGGTVNPTTLQQGGSQAYVRSNVLATVSQSGGTPTGGLIERGTNANGEYVRFADGTQICTYYDSTGLDANTASSGLFAQAADKTWTFPAAFANTTALAVNCSMEVTNRTGTTGTVSTTTVTYNNLRGAASAGTIGARLLAIGRWF